MIRLLLAAALAAPCIGCASVTRGTTENISISSTPSGATAEVTGLGMFRPPASPRAWSWPSAAPTLR